MYCVWNFCKCTGAEATVPPISAKIRGVLVSMSAQPSASVLERRKWCRKERDLQAQIERLKCTVDHYKKQVDKLKDACNVFKLMNVVDAGNGNDLTINFPWTKRNFNKKEALVVPNNIGACRSSTQLVDMCLRPHPG